MTSINIKLSHLLGHQERTDMLQSPALAHVMMSVSSDDVLTLTGCKELVAQVTLLGWLQLAKQPQGFLRSNASKTCTTASRPDVRLFTGGI